MRIAVIADIHGNLPAFESVLADIERRGVDRTINLGDCVSGPLWPREVCDPLMVREDLGNVATTLILPDSGCRAAWRVSNALDRLGFAGEKLSEAARH